MKRTAEAAEAANRQAAIDLVDFHRGSHLSQRALAGTLSKVRERGVPSSSSEKSQWRARKRIVGEETPYGSCVFDVDLPLRAGPYTIALVNPFAMLYRAFNECEEYRSVFMRAHARRPSSLERPWNMILFFDAVSPSNPLQKGKDPRDMQCIYWAIMELRKLSQEEYWFTSAACRSLLTDVELPGGMSRFLAIVLRTFFGGGCHDFSTTGAVLHARDDGTEVRVFLKHRISVADYKGHAEVLHSMGVNALKPCPLHRAVVSHAKSDVKIFGAGIAPINSTKPEDAATIAPYTMNSCANVRMDSCMWDTCGCTRRGVETAHRRELASIGC